jgi:DNA-directed RNA polymerase specialized sigma24 family protein
VDRLQPDPPVPQVFRDRFIEGWSTDEIAERRGINRNTLLTYFAKGLRTLRERLTCLERDPS